MICNNLFQDFGQKRKFRYWSKIVEEKVDLFRVFNLCIKASSEPCRVALQGGQEAQRSSPDSLLHNIYVLKHKCFHLSSAGACFHSPGFQWCNFIKDGIADYTEIS